MKREKIFSSFSMSIAYSRKRTFQDAIHKNHLMLVQIFRGDFYIFDNIGSSVCCIYQTIRYTKIKVYKWTDFEGTQYIMKALLTKYLKETNLYSTAEIYCFFASTQKLNYITYWIYLLHLVRHLALVPLSQTMTKITQEFQ